MKQGALQEHNFRSPGWHPSSFPSCDSCLVSEFSGCLDHSCTWAPLSLASRWQGSKSEGVPAMAMLYAVCRPPQWPPGALQTSEHRTGEASTHLHLTGVCWEVWGAWVQGTGGPGDTQRVKGRPASHSKLVKGIRPIMTLAPCAKVLAFMAGCRPACYRTPSLNTCPCPSLPDGSSLCLSPDTYPHLLNEYLLSIYAINSQGQGRRGGRTRRPLALPLTVLCSSGRCRRYLRLLLVWSCHYGQSQKAV